MPRIKILIGYLVSGPLLIDCSGFLQKGGHSIEPVQPNFLLISSGGQCYSAIRAFSDSKVETPHLDRFVHAGATFLSEDEQLIFLRTMVIVMVFLKPQR